MGKIQDPKLSGGHQSKLAVAFQQKKTSAKTVARKENPLIPKTRKSTVLESTSRLGSIRVSCTVERGPNYAHHDKEGGDGYVRNVTFKGRRKFSLETTIITSGPFEGQSALVMVPVPSETFPFLDLPPEIRNMIYKLALTREDHDIVVRGVMEKSLRAEWINKKNGRHGIAGELSPNTNLLTVCRQMHVEAGTIFYASNRFHLQHTRALCSFLDKIGILRKQIQCITITKLTDGAYFPARTMDAGNLLAKARELKHIQVNCDALSDENMERLMEAFAPLLKILYKRGENKTQLFKIIDLKRDGRRLCAHHARHYDSNIHSCTGCARAKQQSIAASTSLKNKTFRQLMKQVRHGDEDASSDSDALENTDSDQSSDSLESDGSSDADSDNSDHDDSGSES